jgi:hypothetical protein
MLSITFFFMCMTSRLYLNKLSFQYGSLKKILFFFHTFSLVTCFCFLGVFFYFFCFFLLSIFDFLVGFGFLSALSSLNTISSNCINMSSPLGTSGHIQILGYHQMFVCSSSTNDSWASIAYGPYNKIFSRVLTV